MTKRFGRRRQHDLHAGAALAQAADQLQRLEGGDAAADDQQNARADRDRFAVIAIRTFGPSGKCASYHMTIGDNRQ